MIVITGTVKLASEEEVERVREILVGRAVRSRAEEGNLDYLFSVSLEDPTEIRVIEKWESDEALRAHLAVPDPEFGELLANAEIESAVAVVHETSSERVLFER